MLPTVVAFAHGMQRQFSRHMPAYLSLADKVQSIVGRNTLIGNYLCWAEGTVGKVQLAIDRPHPMSGWQSTLLHIPIETPIVRNQTPPSRCSYSRKSSLCLGSDFSTCFPTDLHFAVVLQEEKQCLTVSLIAGFDSASGHLEIRGFFSCLCGVICNI